MCPLCLCVCPLSSSRRHTQSPYRRCWGCNPLALVGVLWRNITEKMNIHYKGALLDWLTQYGPGSLHTGEVVNPVAA